MEITPERIAADRRWFTATPEQFEAFEQLLEVPLASTAKFEALAARPSPWS